jgi:hypothetical protein
MAINISSMPAAIEKTVPCAFSMELFVFNQDKPFGARFVPGGRTKLPSGNEPDRNAKPNQTLPYLCSACVNGGGGTDQ